MPPSPVRSAVERVTVSPMNPTIWYIDLACGHDLRVVQKTRPPVYDKDGMRRELVCDSCTRRKYEGTGD